MDFLKDGEGDKMDGDGGKRGGANERFPGVGEL